MVGFQLVWFSLVGIKLNEDPTNVVLYRRGERDQNIDVCKEGRDVNEGIEYNGITIKYKSMKNYENLLYHFLSLIHDFL